MRSKKWIAAAAVVALMALPGLASARMDKDGGARLKQCVSSMCKGRDARFCSETLSRSFREDRVDFKRMREAHERMKKILDARRFNRKAFLALTDRMAALHSAMMHRHADAFAAVAARLSPKARKKLMWKFFRASMKMAHHNMMSHSKEEQKDWFSHLNK